MNIARTINSRLVQFAAVVASIIAAAVAAVLLSASPSAAQNCSYAGGNVDCNGWTFEYFLASDSVTATGLTLNNIEFDGESLMYQANFGGLPVLYDGNACGPYVDLLSTLTNSTPTGVQASVFTNSGQQWLEMGANYQIGQYTLYTAFYFGESGEMKMRIFARGLQCNVSHEHYPIFVLDVDLEGNDPSLQYHGVGDEVFYKDGNNWIQQADEADKLVSEFGHNWIVRDPDSGKTVKIQHDSGAFEPPTGNAFEAQGGIDNIIYSRDAGPLREYAWPGAPTNGGREYLVAADFNDGQWAYNDGEALDDPVVVVRGMLRHEVAPNLPDDWHTTGISVLIVDDPFGAPAPTPAATAVPVATSTPEPPLKSTATPVPVAGQFACSSNGGVLTWSNHGQSKYWVYRSIDGGASYSWLGRTTGATTFTDPSPSDGARYQVHYAGIARVDCSTASEPPSAGQQFECSSAGGVLTWSDHGQSKYWVYRSTDGGQSYNWLGRTTGATTFTDPSPTGGARYQVHYAGIPRSDCTIASEPPSLGQQFTCSSNGGVLTWSDHGQSKYWVYRSTNGGQSYSWLARTTGATTYTDPSPVRGALYQVHYAGIPRSNCT